jgi:anti-sigma factor RsiW
MRTCEESKAALVELVFGEMDHESEMHLNRHLAACIACRAEEQRLLGLRDAVAGGEVTPPEALRARIHELLPARRTARRFAFLQRPVPAFAALAACLAGVLLVLALPRGHRPGGAPEGTGMRARRVPISAVVPAFEPAGSFDTGLMVTAPSKSLADSSLPDSGSGGDSL